MKNLINKNNNNNNNNNNMDQLFKYNLKQLITLGAHLGHHKKKRAFFMTNHLLGHRNNVDIIDLNKTIQSLNITLPVISETIQNSGKILFVAENAKYLAHLESDFNQLKQPLLKKPWVLGTLTNFNKSLDKTSGVEHLNRLPDLIVIVHASHPDLILQEAKSLEIPTILFNDTNINPQRATYSIPTNDDTLDLTNLYLTIIKKTILTAFAEHILKFNKSISS